MKLRSLGVLLGALKVETTFSIATTPMRRRAAQHSVTESFIVAGNMECNGVAHRKYACSCLNYAAARTNATVATP